MIEKITKILQYWIPPLISIAIVLFYTAGIMFVFLYYMRDTLIITYAILMIGGGFLSLAAHIIFFTDYGRDSRGALAE